MPHFTCSVLQLFLVLGGSYLQLLNRLAQICTEGKRCSIVCGVREGFANLNLLNNGVSFLQRAKKQGTSKVAFRPLGTTICVTPHSVHYAYITWRQQLSSELLVDNVTFNSIPMMLAH